MHTCFSSFQVPNRHEGWYFTDRLGNFRLEIEFGWVALQKIKRTSTVIFEYVFMPVNWEMWTEWKAR